MSARPTLGFSLDIGSHEVTSVKPGGIADRAGLVVGDVIVMLDDMGRRRAGRDGRAWRHAPPCRRDAAEVSAEWVIGSARLRRGCRSITRVPDTLCGERRPCAFLGLPMFGARPPAPAAPAGSLGAAASSEPPTRRGRCLRRRKAVWHE